MSTPAFGIELPRFVPTEEAFSMKTFLQEVKDFAAELRTRTTPHPAANAMRAPATTSEDPEFQSGERAIQRDSRPSMDDDTLVSARVSAG